MPRAVVCVPARAVATVCVPALADAAGAVAAVCVPARADAVVAAVEVSVACHVCAGAARTERQAKLAARMCVQYRVVTLMKTVLQTTIQILAPFEYSQKAKLSSECYDKSDFVLNFLVQNITLKSRLTQSMVLYRGQQVHIF